jgi:hypothetical protein
MSSPLVFGALYRRSIGVVLLVNSACPSLCSNHATTADDLKRGPNPGGLKKWTPFWRIPATILFLIVFGFTLSRSATSAMVRYSSLIPPPAEKE